MRNWLNFHPDKNNPEAFVWVITSEFHKKRYKKQLDYQAVYSILQDLGQKTEIKKDCNPHNFRHSRASLLANHLTEAQMNEFFGWSHWGKTAAIYTHISGRDIDEAILKANGVKKEETAVVTELMPKVCIRCRFMNSISNKFCEKCFFPLDSTAAMEMEKKEKLFYDNLMSGKTLEQVAEEIIQRKLEEMLKK
jgi:ribosomal protein L40E